MKDPIQEQKLYYAARAPEYENGDAVHRGRKPVGSGVERRRLRDGREFDIVKHYRGPADFPHLDLRITANGHFIYGGGRP